MQIMSTKLPYVVQPGSIKKILEKVREAKTPDRFTTDFLDTKLGFRGGNYRQFIPLAKKLNLLNSDGTPTELYKAFRNPTTAKASIAEAMKSGYQELFDRNEYAGNLSKEDLKGLVVLAEKPGVMLAEGIRQGYFYGFAFFTADFLAPFFALLFESPRRSFTRVTARRAASFDLVV
jgi:hypothetical protein